MESLNNERIVFKSDQPVDIVIYGDRLDCHSNSENGVFIYDDQVSVNLKLSDRGKFGFHTQGYLSILKLDEMNNAIDSADACNFSAMDNYEDYGDCDDIDLWDLGIMMIKKFVGEIKYKGQILGTGKCEDFEYWHKIKWSSNDLCNAILTIPVSSDRIVKLPHKLLSKMSDKWWSQ